MGDTELAVKAGAVGIVVIGASMAAMSAAAVIAATGGAAAVGLVGYGIYKLCNRGSGNKKEN